MEKWVHIHKYWLAQDHIDSTRRHVVIYEDLIDSAQGAQEAFDMVQFIQQSTHVPPIMSANKIPCIWYRVLQLNNHPYHHGGTVADPSHHQLQPQTRRRKLREKRNKQSSSQHEIDLIKMQPLILSYLYHLHTYSLIKWQVHLPT